MWPRMQLEQKPERTALMRTRCRGSIRRRTGVQLLGELELEQLCTCAEYSRRRGVQAVISSFMVAAQARTRSPFTSRMAPFLPLPIGVKAVRSKLETCLIWSSMESAQHPIRWDGAAQPRGRFSLP